MSDLLHRDTHIQYHPYDRLFHRRLTDRSYQIPLGHQPFLHKQCMLIARHFYRYNKTLTLCTQLFSYRYLSFEDLLCVFFCIFTYMLDIDQCQCRVKHRRCSRIDDRFGSVHLKTDHIFGRQNIGPIRTIGFAQCPHLYMSLIDANAIILKNTQ